MAKTSIVYHHKNDSPEKEAEIIAIKTALAEAFVDVRFVYVDNNKDFLTSLTEKIPDFVIFDWSAYRAPTEVVELYYQSLYAKYPMIIHFEHFSEEEIVFLREYNVEETLRISVKRKPAGYAGLVSLIKSVLTPTTDKIKKRLIELQIHHSLHNHKVLEAFELYKKIHSIIPEHERVFFQAKILKEQKKYKEAIQKIVDEKNKTLGLVGLMGSVFHQMGSHDKAAKFLELAAQKSPKNLRRNYMLYTSYSELGKTDGQYRTKAMKSLVQIHKLSPDYNGVNEKMIGMVMANQTIENIPLINSLLSMASPREITKIFKKIEGYEEPFRSSFIDKFVRTLSEKANELILQDDITALKYYSYIRKLLPKNDTNRLMALDYCVARAYFRFGQLEIAKEKNDLIIEQSGGNYQKSAALKILIEKALRGEFDVLLDDEKDWLKEA